MSLKDLLTYLLTYLLCSKCHWLLLHPIDWTYSKADSGSHFVIRDPHDPWPSPRPWHESITTTRESCWVRDYCLLFSALMCNLKFWIWLIIQWIFP